MKDNKRAQADFGTDFGDARGLSTLVNSIRQLTCGYLIGVSG
jgi:hypothetical protein